MSFQAYLDTIEDKAGPSQIPVITQEEGFADSSVKARTILDWLKEDCGLGRGHGMALVRVIKNGPQIDTKHVRSAGAHRDESKMLWLDGKAAKPTP